MNILVVSQYFYPEEFKINDLVAELVKRGHQVTVLTGKPNYPKGTIFEGYKQWGVQRETVFGATVIRVPIVPRHNGRAPWLLLNYLSFQLSSCLYAWTHRMSFDKIFCWDTSPINQVRAGIIAKKKCHASLSIWVQDLWPESVSATVPRLNKAWIMKPLLRFVRNTYKHFDTIFVQSPAFIPSIKEKGDFKARYVLAPNWAEDLYTDPTLIDPQRYKSLIPEGFIVMFAGNHGTAQGFNYILKAAELTKDHPEIKWVFVGDGRAKHDAELLAASKGLSQTVTFLGRHSITEMPSLFVHADVMLISLIKHPIFAMTIPGKTQTYMAARKPIVTIMDGVGNDVVNKAQCGLTAGAEDYEALARNVITLSQTNRDELLAMGQRAGDYYRENFSRDSVVSRIIENL